MPRYKGLSHSFLVFCKAPFTEKQEESLGARGIEAPRKTEEPGKLRQCLGRKRRLQGDHLEACVFHEFCHDVLCTICLCGPAQSGPRPSSPPLLRASIVEMRKDHEEQLQRLKLLKDREIDAVTSATSHTRYMCLPALPTRGPRPG